MESSRPPDRNPFTNAHLSVSGSAAVARRRRRPRRGVAHRESRRGRRRTRHGSGGRQPRYRPLVSGRT